MWFFLPLACASTLDFLSFELTGSKTGVSLAYVLAADDWMTIAQQRASGVPTAVTVTLETDDYRYTAVVPVNAAAREVNLSLRPWPVGTRGTLALRRGDFEDLSVAGTSAETLEVKVEGGIEGARPNNPPLSSDPQDRPPPQPVANLPRPTQPKPSPTTTPDPVLVPEPGPPQTTTAAVEQHTIIDACKRIFVDPEDQGLCIAALVQREQPIEELIACGGLARVRHQRSCVETVSLRMDPFTQPIEACIEAFGSGGDGQNCVQAAGRHAGDPMGAIESCTTHLADPSDATACIKKAARMQHPVEDVLRACSIGFPEEPLDCLARASRSPFDRADLVNACTTFFVGEDRQRCLSILAPAKGRDAAGAVRACVRLFERVNLRMDCMDRARNQPSEERILYCGELPRRDAQLSCIGR